MDHLTKETPEPVHESERSRNQSDYYVSTLRIVAITLFIWFVVSYGCGILLREWLDKNFPSIGGAPFGFWMSQQGSILCFVGLLLFYRVRMNKLDKQFGFQDQKGNE